MLKVYTTDEFSDWFAAQSDEVAEEVATRLDVVQELGPERCAPNTSEWVIWYAVPEAPQFEVLEQWARFRDHALWALGQLQSASFVERFNRLAPSEAAAAKAAIEHIKAMAGISRKGLGAAAHGGSPWVTQDRRSAITQAYRDALLSAGLDDADLPAHTLAMRQLMIEMLPAGEPAHAFHPAATRPSTWVRLLYGVDSRRHRALVLVGEHLDRHFYGDAVRRAERHWKQFLASESTKEKPMSKRQP